MRRVSSALRVILIVRKQMVKSKKVNAA